MFSLTLSPSSAKRSPAVYFPVTHVGPDEYPSLNRPLLSAVDLPVPSSNPNAARSVCADRGDEDTRVLRLTQSSGISAY